MSDLFFEFDAQVHSPSVIAVPQSFNETGYDYNIVGSSDDDLSIASQSNSMGEITVVGSIQDGTLRFEFARSSGDETEDKFSPDEGGGAIPTYWDFLQLQCQADATTDDVARQIEALIKAQPDWNSREYAAVIYLVGNEIKMGPLVRGMTVAEAEAAGLDAPETRLSSPSDLGDGVILAVVHSHPDIGYSDQDDLINRYPSDRPDSGDYYGFEQLTANDSRFIGNKAFSQYILGSDGVLREFNLIDGRITKNNDTSPDSRSDLASDRPCFG